ncbi:phosphoribosyltransferase [Mycobacterium sp. MS1601]|uniref:ComF family protein n=1 Tax=Mycobacterium sp. MS1601 TaxID=1936029 RepID=UPI0009797D50|nr:ComF family protein [Mycobacterium sp. MS1601]AQA01428.1 phosphoribosyltransferase [Mycobacterium sp. MS1601]
MLDLVLPLECGGCGAPGTRWCDACATALRVGADDPHVITPRLDPGVPVFALGRHAGTRRRAIVALKEHGRVDLLSPLAHALAGGIHRLLAWGVLDEPLALVPAPTRRIAARRRGGDPVSRLCASAVRAHPEIVVTPALRLKRGTRDSVGLGSGDRQRNLAGRVHLDASKLISRVDVLVVDDIVTTGATACESVRVLSTAGVRVAAVLALAHA